MLRCTGSDRWRRGCLPLSGDMEPFASARLAGRPSSARIDVAATTTTAPTAATMKRSRLRRRRDLVSPSRSARTRCADGRAGKTKDAWLPPQCPYVAEVRTRRIVSLKLNLTTFDFFPLGLTQKHVKLMNVSKILRIFR